ncbi:MAG: M15 family metallopeptidase [Burkholderiales bacterium]
MKACLFTAAALLALLLAGCSQQAVIASPAPTQAETMPSMEASLPPSTTPVKTTQPEPEPMPEEKGKVVIADGFYYIELSDEIKERITGLSYPTDDTGCKISYDDLRYIKLKHYDFEGRVHGGELIVNKALADEVTNIFYELYKAKYPLTSVKLVDDFGQPGDDTLSMEANNTSAFCYRTVFGGGHLSRHSYGAAIDINPLYNPYLDDGRIAPLAGAPYADRTKDFPGKIDHDDLAYKLFKKYG